jgi:hypothetical protein
MSFNIFQVDARNISPLGKQQILDQVNSERKAGETWEEISKKCPVSKRTLQRWSKTDMSIPAIMKRKRSSHRTPLLTIEEKNKIIQRAIVERMNHRIVNQKWTKETISNVTNTRVQEAGKGFITNFLEKNHW